MNAMKTVELLRKYNACQKCGSDALGNGAGSLEVTDNIFKRTCKCGWSVEVDESGKSLDELVVKPGVYKKGIRTRICLGQEGFFVYYKTPSNLGQTSGIRVDLWKKWVKGAICEKEVTT